MASIRKFFRTKSSSGTASDPTPRSQESSNKPQPNRLISSPLNNTTSSPPLTTPGEHGSQPSEGSTLGSGATATESLRDSPAPISPLPSPATVEQTEPAVLDGLGGIMNTADEVIRDAEKKEEKREARDKASRVIEAYAKDLELTDAAKIIRSQVTAVLIEEPWFIRGLDELAKLHFFARATVLVIKTVYNLETARQNNDKRIGALYTEMRGMIDAIIRLKGIKDPDINIMGPNEITIQSRMEPLLNAAAEELKACANTCDTWRKKKTVIKVFVGPAWEDKLAAFAAKFKIKRMEIDFALQMHIASITDKTYVMTQSLIEKVSSLQEQFVLAFGQLRPSEEVRLAEEIVKNNPAGIQAIRSNEAALREAFDIKVGGDPHSAQDGDGDGPRTAQGPRPAKQSEYTFNDFKDELRQDLDAALKENMQGFERRFKLRFDQMEGDLRKFIQESSKYIVSEVTKGPHDLIRNPDLKVIWKEMHWRRNVKARLFVMTLRDHFADMAEDTSTLATNHKSTAVRSGHATDWWARRYVDVKYLQPIMDAIDDDGSGHITIAEINRFTEMLPDDLGWNLTLWLAYWAIGWQTFATRYCAEIHQLFARLFALRENVHPMNRDQIEYYLSLTWSVASVLVKPSTAPAVQIPDYAREKFEEYAKYEEDRIRKNLTSIKYDIDALETVYVVLGAGRVEKNILTLICLMLRKDLELFEVAATDRLHEDELWDAADSMLWVHDAVSIRYQGLVAQWRQQKLEVDKQLYTISCDIFHYFHTSESRQRMLSLLATSHVERTYEVLPTAQLGEQPAYNYALQAAWPYRCEVYEDVQEVPSVGDQDAPEMVKPFLGKWTGFVHDDGFVKKSIFTFDAHLAPPGADHHIEAKGVILGVPFTLRAIIAQEDGVLKIQAVTQYERHYMDDHYAGTLQPDGSIIGSQGYEGDVTKHEDEFLWMQIREDLMILRPMPPYNVPSKTDNSLVPNKARAMFNYAIEAVIFQYRRSTWREGYFEARRNIRLRYIEFCVSWEKNGQTDTCADNATRSQILRPMVSADREFYKSIAQVQWQTLPHHTNNCDTCKKNCQGVCLTCIDCVYNATPEASYGNSVDFCALECSKTPVHPSPHAVKEPHDPSHSLMKRRKVLQLRDLPRVFSRAKEAIAAFREQFKLEPSLQGGNDSGVDTKAPPACGVCHKSLAMPCWFCVECFMRKERTSHFICDDCEEHSLLQCVGCKKPFKQPKWWYGWDPKDNYTCNMCTAKRVSVESTSGISHTYLHCLVRCYQQAAERPADNNVAANLGERMAAIEKQIVAIGSRLAPADTLSQNVDSLTGRISRLEGSLERIEQLLSMFAAPPQS